MALKGTLTDLGIVDLVQFPFSGRKTGELMIRSPRGEARLFYDEGALVDASCNGHQGCDAVTEVVDWEAGEFEFNPGIQALRKTIDQELHRVVMQALKARDERKMEEQRRKVEQDLQKNATSESAGAGLNRLLKDFTQSHSFLLHACILSLKGEALAESASSSEPLEGLEELRVALHTLRREHPRPGLQRIIVEDQIGTVLGTMINGGAMLVTVAAKGPALGAVSIAVSKLTTSLTSEMNK